MCDNDEIDYVHFDVRLHLHENAASIRDEVDAGEDNKSEHKIGAQMQELKSWVEGQQFVAGRVELGASSASDNLKNQFNKLYNKI
jgi:hypothetical protein